MIIIIIVNNNNNNKINIRNNNNNNMMGIKCVLQRFKKILELCLSKVLVQDPHTTQTKGRPKEGKGCISSKGRLKSSIEMSSSCNTKKCIVCKVPGSNRRNCK